MKTIIENSLNNTLKNLNMPVVEFSLQIPKNKEHGDLATNIAFLLSKKIGDNPLNIATEIKTELEKTNLFSEVSIANPGFINMRINPEAIVDNLNFIISKENKYGANNSGEGKKILLEFVSANPTGPLTVGHGRGAILGDCLKEILSWNGFDVDTEYYYNNAGRQMRILAESVLARYNEINGQEFNFPEDGYQGEYIKEIASNFKTECGDKVSDKEINKFKDFSENQIFTDIKSTLKDIGIIFNSFFNENTLYENKNIYSVIDRLKEKDLIYEKDGATWLKATAMGGKQDRVYIKSSGEPTYRLPDTAYHREKIERGFDLVVDIFGADHADSYPDVLAALAALDLRTDHIRVLLYQFVTLLRGKEKIKMSTRMGDFITLDDLMNEISHDVVRYFFIMRSMNSHLDFDLDLAKDQSEKNPVFYLQYAHARICNIIKHGMNTDHEINKNFGPGLLSHEDEIRLMKQLVYFPEIIEIALESLEPQGIANYLQELAARFHKFYGKCRVITENEPLSQARLGLISSVRIVLSSGLSILGISAPDRM